MDITVEELREKLDRKDSFVLIDVREPDEHEAFNVGGELIPLALLPEHLSDLQDHRNDEIVVYCRSGRRSATAQQFLRQAGFRNVRNLEGGMLAWIDAFGTEK